MTKKTRKVPAKRPVAPPKPFVKLEDEEALKYSPHKNHKVISIYALDDGSWVGETFRFQKVVTVREAKPEDCLLKLMTHNGQ